MKTGANFEDINKIERMAEAGMSAKDISQRLVIELKVVQGFMPKKPEAKPEAKPAVPKAKEGAK